MEMTIPVVEIDGWSMGPWFKLTYPMDKITVGIRAKKSL